MKFRWTIKGLVEKSDDEILIGLVVERQSELNPCAPLYKRLDKIYAKLHKCINSQLKQKGENHDSKL